MTTMHISKSAKLYWNNYKYFPYERKLAESEVLNFIQASKFNETNEYIEIKGRIEADKLKQLAYFSHFQNNGHKEATFQYLSELKNGKNIATKRQSTRYSAHGLHEYKGKFNPQVVRSLLNILGVKSYNHILDPFCGSGTSLIECAHRGIAATGFDINPLAVYISNAKLKTLSVDPDIFFNKAERITRVFKNKIGTFKMPQPKTLRGIYLRKWFTNEMYNSISLIKRIIDEDDKQIASIFLTVASNLLRDYSLQEPSDLRIRKRYSPMPEKSFIASFEQALELHYQRILAAREVYGTPKTHSQAFLLDSRNLSSAKIFNSLKNKFYAAITSPPYATALPYIDTQRLSLVWLELCEPFDLLDLEAQLAGSRELRGKQKSIWNQKLEINENGLPESIVEYCRRLSKAISVSDGFRRQAMPSLLYRYFADMKQMFVETSKLLTKNGYYALIVGHNHTVLGGKRFDIDTPNFLTHIAERAGWNVESNTPLETYQRYGLHSTNSIASEALLILKAK